MSNIQKLILHQQSHQYPNDFVDFEKTLVFDQKDIDIYMKIAPDVDQFKTLKTTIKEFPLKNIKKQFKITNKETCLQALDMFFVNNFYIDEYFKYPKYFEDNFKTKNPDFEKLYKIFSKSLLLGTFQRTDLLEYVVDKSGLIVGDGPVYWGWDKYRSPRTKVINYVICVRPLIFVTDDKKDIKFLKDTFKIKYFVIMKDKVLFNNKEYEFGDDYKKCFAIISTLTFNKYDMIDKVYDKL